MAPDIVKGVKVTSADCGVASDSWYEDASVSQLPLASSSEGVCIVKDGDRGVKKSFPMVGSWADPELALTAAGVSEHSIGTGVSEHRKTLMGPLTLLRWIWKLSSGWGT